MPGQQSTQTVVASGPISFSAEAKRYGHDAESGVSESCTSSSSFCAGSPSETPFAMPSTPLIIPSIMPTTHSMPGSVSVSPIPSRSASPSNEAPKGEVRARLSQITSLKHQLQSAQTNLHITQIQLDNANTQLQLALTEVQSAKARMREYAVERKRMGDRIRRLEAENRSLKGQLVGCAITSSNSKNGSGPAEDAIGAIERKRQLLDKWKHVYRTRAAKNVRDGAPGSIAWFYSEFDYASFGIWRLHLHPELAETVSSPEECLSGISVLYERFSASPRDYFAIIGVLAAKGEVKTNAPCSTIQANSHNPRPHQPYTLHGILITRGEKLDPRMVMEVSMGRWSYSPLDMTSWEDQTYLEGVLAWTLDLGEEGRWVTGKAFD